MAKMRELHGTSAAVGLAQGALFFPKKIAEIARVAGNCAEETQALTAAIDVSVEDLSGLLTNSNEETAGIVEFQIVMLEDDELRAPAIEEIKQGVPAEAAWKNALDTQIADYQASDDENFRARAGDLGDLRDRVLRHLLGAAVQAMPAGTILFDDEATPTQFVETDWRQGGGIALKQGSKTSHVSMLARATGVPMVIGLGDVDVTEHSFAQIDGDSGAVILSPDTALFERFDRRLKQGAEQRERWVTYLEEPAVTADGTPIQVMINIVGPEELERIDPNHCDGIGLMRSEFLFRDGGALPTEEQQYRIYRRVLEWAKGRPVTIRTLDAGGDKPISGVTVDNEGNPFLGVRGLRLSLAKPEIFRVQLRALARAAVHGNLKVMWPMVTLASELNQAETILEEVLAALEGEGVACTRPALGMMVEVPAAAMTLDLFGRAEFFSIGSNDLAQYLMAAARDNAAVAELADPSHPALLRLIDQVVEYCREMGRDLSICGDMASDPNHLDRLIQLGLRTLSVSPAALGEVKAAIHSLRLGEGGG
jgi:phosphotransferase system enzyme I (PtsI)